MNYRGGDWLADLRASFISNFQIFPWNVKFVKLQMQGLFISGPDIHHEEIVTQCTFIQMTIFKMFFAVAMVLEAKTFFADQKMLKCVILESVEVFCC